CHTFTAEQRKSCIVSESEDALDGTGEYETSVHQEKQDDLRSTSDAENHNTDHANLQAERDCQNILELKMRTAAKKDSVRVTQPALEIVPYYVDEDDFLTAAVENKMGIIERYLEKGGDPDVCDNFNRTALHRACSHGNVKVVKRLLEAGARIEKKDKLHSTPVHCACRGGNLAALKLLLDHNGSVSARDKLNSTPLHVAVRTAHHKCAEHLLQSGANVNAKDREGDTPMHDAVKLNGLKTIELLLQHGANLQIKNCEGKSPMDSVLQWQNGAKSILINNSTGTRK
uniref:Ankyrin repeat domain-containing protein 1 n=1 Tax=Denticeps clupeoides TaxID=299321 RepID=A0AAY4DCI9_9TELE